jgi:hypothetical protein
MEALLITPRERRFLKRDPSSTARPKGAQCLKKEWVNNILLTPQNLVL